MTSPAKNGLHYRNAIADHEGVASDLTLEAGFKGEPLVTIAIPTYRRPDLLVDAIESAAAQAFDRPFEIVVVDNEPSSTPPAALTARFSAEDRIGFRYFVNRDNIGMFGNWNRCVQLARGEWLTILNDDDLLDPDWLASCFALLERDRGIDGISTRKRYLRMGAQPSESTSASMTLRARLAAGRMARSAVYRLHFGGGASRRLHARQFFWGPIAGTPLGFLFRTRCAREIGGFYAEEHPAADLWFYTRFASRFHLRQHRAPLATVRILENESAKPETVVRSLRSVHQLQQALAGTEAPGRWSKYGPLVLARLRSAGQRAFGVTVPDAELDAALGMHLGADRPRRLAALRFLSGGWHPDPA